MWIFTEEGFLSVVADYSNDANLLVRARVRSDLETFILRACPDAQIEVTPTRDYRFRCSVPAHVVAEWVRNMVWNITYPNFKDRVHETDPDDDRAEAYLNVWRAIHTLQHDRRVKDEAQAHKKAKTKAAKRRKKNKIRQWRA